MFDKDKFLKIISLTTSDQDGEALSALRKALSMMKQSKITWRELIDKPQQTHQPYQRHWQPKESEEQIKLRLLINDVRIKGSTRDFIVSLSQAAFKFGRLTQKQSEALDKVFFRYYNEEK